MLMDFNLQNCTKYHQSSLVSIDSVEKNYILTTADLYFDAAVIA